jgi:hypothetical protein
MSGEKFSPFNTEVFVLTRLNLYYVFLAKLIYMQEQVSQHRSQKTLLREEEAPILIDQQHNYQRLVCWVGQGQGLGQGLLPRDWGRFTISYHLVASYDQSCETRASPTIPYCCRVNQPTL